ncbi:TIGR00730 family Rossman fold protein [Pseudalkalibacillus sp. SCS-8]|uniref:LOG family protein n=1 Tax=Pseudalkalibacillus nanhaiensis TaxID=3115291 RepID=UPI0032DAD4EA
MYKFSSICVFCGSSFGTSNVYQDEVKKLGSLLARHNIELVYGGGNSGLMGVLANAVMENQGKATGIITRKIYENVDHLELTDLKIVESMHERKSLMYELADAFIALPGGIGTMEEMFEVMTWNQIGYHLKPLGLFNIDHYYDPVKDLIQHMFEEGFVQKQHLEQTIFEDDAVRLLERLNTQEISQMNKWN